MAEPTLITFSYKEVVEALIKQQGIHEGIWALYVEFGIGAANVGSGPSDIAPTAIVPVVKLGLVKANEINNLSVDAAAVNPAPKASDRPARKKAAQSES